MIAEHTREDMKEGMRPYVYRRCAEVQAQQLPRPWWLPQFATAEFVFFLIHTFFTCILLSATIYTSLAIMWGEKPEWTLMILLKTMYPMAPVVLGCWAHRRLFSVSASEDGVWKVRQMTPGYYLANLAMALFPSLGSGFLINFCLAKIIVPTSKYIKEDSYRSLMLPCAWLVGCMSWLLFEHLFPYKFRTAEDKRRDYGTYKRWCLKPNGKANWEEWIKKGPHFFLHIISCPEHATLCKILEASIMRIAGVSVCVFIVWSILFALWMNVFTSSTKAMFELREHRVFAMVLETDALSLLVNLATMPFLILYTWRSEPSHTMKYSSVTEPLDQKVVLVSNEQGQPQRFEASDVQEEQEEILNEVVRHICVSPEVSADRSSGSMCKCLASWVSRPGSIAQQTSHQDIESGSSKHDIGSNVIHSALSDIPERTDYNELLEFVKKVAEVAQRTNGFVLPRGMHGYHILFDESEMLPYFDMIRNDLARGQSGVCLKHALSIGTISANSCDRQLWSALIQSLKFSGKDFEHEYNILPSQGDAAQKDIHICDYSFAESIVLSHTLLLVPVMQHYGPLMPKLDLNGPTKKLEQPKPLLVVGMVGDCVKGSFFNEIKRKAEEGDKMAQRQKYTLLNPERLQQKMRGLVRTLLHARNESEMSGLILDATLVGSGAFGGSIKVLGQPFVESLNGGDLPFDNSKDEVNFYMFPPPKPDELTLEHVKYNVSLNNKKGLGAAPAAADKRVRILVAGFDPISLAPHGVLNRAFSAEGQICHATDFLYRTTGITGKFVNVKVPRGRAWESPAAFFAQPQEHKFKEEEAYSTVRFVPEIVLDAEQREQGVSEEADGQLEAIERVPPRVWNGDAFDGWNLSLDGVVGRTWQEVLLSQEIPVQ